MSGQDTHHHESSGESKTKMENGEHATPTSNRNGKETQIITNAGKDVEELEASYTPAVDIKWYSGLGKQPGRSSKVTHCYHRIQKFHSRYLSKRIESICPQLCHS